MALIHLIHTKCNFKHLSIAVFAILSGKDAWTQEPPEDLSSSDAMVHFKHERLLLASMSKGVFRFTKIFNRDRRHRFSFENMKQKISYYSM